MRPAFQRVDVVGEREDRLAVAVVVLQHDVAHHARLFALAMNPRRFVQHRFAFVEMLKERQKPFLVAVFNLLARTLVVQRNPHALVQVRQFAKPVHQRLVAELRFGEYLVVGHERDLRPGLRAFADLGQLALLMASLERHLIHVAIATDFYL